MFSAIGKLVPGVAFAIFTGDIVDHAMWNTSEQYNTNVINDAYLRMARSTIPFVYGTAGNHESHPVGSFPPRFKFSEPPGMRDMPWIYGVLANSWKWWIGGDEATEDVLWGGIYSTKYPLGNLRVISLNTNLFYTFNFWLYEEPSMLDPDDQLMWLSFELADAEERGERVYIIGHMPMGVPDAFRAESHLFDLIVNRYSDTIAAMFFGEFV
jgi:sphingomyelin phosphodiesterase